MLELAAQYQSAADQLAASPPAPSSQK